MTTLHAQPYNLDATGFYFDSLDAYTSQSENHTDLYGNHVEEYEIQFIDGDDAQLFEACGINQTNLATWFDEVEMLNDYQKACLFCLCGNVGYSLELALQSLDDVCLSQCSLQDASEELFDEIYLHDVPEAVRCYIDYEKFARDCEIGGDMAEFDYNGDRWTCTNASCI